MPLKDAAGPTIHITEYTDPYCTWCWGSEPILRRIETAYGNQVRISFVMGGLVADIDQFYDPVNRIGGEGWREAVATHWLQASARHGMPVDVRIFTEFSSDFRSTYPANIAVKAAELQGEVLAHRFLRRIREGVAAEASPIHRLTEQERLGMEIGLDIKRFREAIGSGKAKRAFQIDQEECRKHGVTGFPTFRIANRLGEERWMTGYRPFLMFQRVFMELAEDSLKEHRVENADASIVDIIRQYGRMATQEVAEVVGGPRSEIFRRLIRLADDGKVIRHPRGNGEFWSTV